MSWQALKLNSVTMIFQRSVLELSSCRPRWQLRRPKPKPQPYTHDADNNNSMYMYVCMYVCIYIYRLK